MFPGSIPRRSTVTAMIIALMVLTLAPAVVHGIWSGRWRGGTDMAAAAKMVADFPRQFGNWAQEGDETQMPEEAVRELQCAGYFNRHYVNQKLGRDVTVLLMVGPSGPLVRHPPEICYGNQANQLVHEPTTENLATSDARNHNLRLLCYKSPGSVSGEFSVCYGWTDDGTWAVPDYPRLRFGSAPLLYKIQILTADRMPHDGGLPVATARFLDEFLPRLSERIAKLH
jgi:Protein of unknown function (DUF3485)